MGRFFFARKDCLVEMEEAAYRRKWVTFWYIMCTTSLVYRLTAKSDLFCNTFSGISWSKEGPTCSRESLVLYSNMRYSWFQFVRYVFRWFEITTFPNLCWQLRVTFRKKMSWAFFKFLSLPGGTGEASMGVGKSPAGYDFFRSPGVCLCVEVDRPRHGIATPKFGTFGRGVLWRFWTCNRLEGNHLLWWCTVLNGLVPGHGPNYPDLLAVSGFNIQNLVRVVVHNIS